VTSIIDAARAAIVSGAPTITIDSRDLLVLGNELQRLEARVEELRRRYEPTMAEWIEDADAQAVACWG
jgi:hypothetical protein